MPAGQLLSVPLVPCHSMAASAALFIKLETRLMGVLPAGFSQNLSQFITLLKPLHILADWQCFRPSP